MPADREQGWRNDIQALRAFAVAAVVAFHLGIPGCGRGYLGVDVFFVISGYLIGGRLETMAGTSGLDFAALGRFWRARINRLWPAAVVTLVVTVVPCAWLLDWHEWTQYLWQLAGSAALSANFVLWQQTDYFGGGAGTKPLLHFWSLAVEEQFYLLAPLVFFLPAARWRRRAIGLITALSLALFLFLAPRSPSAAFYFLPTRGWELGLGVMLAQGGQVWALGPWFRPLIWAGLAGLIAAGSVVSEEIVLLGAVAFSALLVASPPPAQTIPRWLTAVGDRSYAIYLVHWPIIALAENIWMRGPPPEVRLGLLGLIALAAEALWQLVDRRDRARRRPSRWAALLGLVLAGALGAIWLVPARARDDFRQPNEGLGMVCNLAGPFDLRHACRSGPTADTVVWGDSFAMQLIPGLAMISPGVIQATRVVCGPIVGLAPIGPGYSSNWAGRCIAWNDAVLAAIVHDKSIHVVVLGSIFNQYVAGAVPDWQFALRRAGRISVQPQDDQVLAASLRTTIAALDRAGKTVVLYRPQYYPDYDLGRCISRRADNLPTQGVAGDCGFDRNAAAPASRVVDAWFGALVAEAGPARTWRLLDPQSELCPGSRCLSRRDGVPLFADTVHLSQGGSIWLSKTMNWAGVITRNPVPKVAGLPR